MAESSETFPLEIGKDVLFDGVTHNRAGCCSAAPNRPCCSCPPARRRTTAASMVRVVYRPLVERVEAAAAGDRLLPWAPERRAEPMAA